MNKEQLLEKFKLMFPSWAPHIASYKKIGSKTLAIEFNIGPVKKVSRVFLYNNPDNWQFGTKLWRKRPKKMKKKPRKNSTS